MFIKEEKMAERDLIKKETLEFEGLFDFPGFYGFANNWLKDERYGVDEERYVEGVSGNERKLTIEWKASKKISDFFKIEHKINFMIFNLTDVEVEIDGEKKKMNKGKIETSVKAGLVSDPDSKWDRSPFLRFWREIYSKYIISGRVDAMRYKVQDDAQAFVEELKAYLNASGKREFVKARDYDLSGEEMP